jgi:peptidoglycan/xylan/chitin deacetylase (PgdA/CDA1 family)
MGKPFKLAFLYASKFLGLFHISRYIYRHALRVLCYHGFALMDEHLFRPSLFVTAKTFERRLNLLRKHRFPVISLESAVKKLKEGGLPHCATVITIDDGFYSTYRIARDLLKSFSFPATLYVTTYYCTKETPVFRLVIQYMFWKTRCKIFDLAELDLSLSGKFDLANAKEKERATWSIIEFGEKADAEEQRLTLECRLGKLLGVDLEEIAKTRILSLTTSGEMRSLMEDGIDIQLHTHRHRFPSDKGSALKELKENRSILESIVCKELSHFCYPSGEWSPESWPILASVGVRSAVTCDPGLNYRNTPILALNRFLDGEHISQIEFEAELVGYTELLRRFRSRSKSTTVVQEYIRT